MEIIRWEQGRPLVDALLMSGKVDRVQPSRKNAAELLAQADHHLRSAQLIASDPVGAFQLAYDSARKALMAILVNEGLRVRSGEGGHATVLEIVLAQLDPPLGTVLRQFDWMRRLRNASEYPDFEHPVAGIDDVKDAISSTTKILAVARRVVEQMPVY